MLYRSIENSFQMHDCDIWAILQLCGREDTHNRGTRDTVTLMQLRRSASDVPHSKTLTGPGKMDGLVKKKEQGNLSLYWHSYIYKYAFPFFSPFLSKTTCQRHQWVCLFLSQQPHIFKLLFIQLDFLYFLHSFLRDISNTFYIIFQSNFVIFLFLTIFSSWKYQNCASFSKHRS